jgi:hypothetical protein
MNPSALCCDCQAFVDLKDSIQTNKILLGMRSDDCTEKERKVTAAELEVQRLQDRVDQARNDYEALEIDIQNAEDQAFEMEVQMKRRRSEEEHEMATERAAMARTRANGNAWLSRRNPPAAEAAGVLESPVILAFGTPTSVVNASVINLLDSSSEDESNSEPCAGGCGRRLQNEDSNEHGECGHCELKRVSARGPKKRKTRTEPVEIEWRINPNPTCGICMEQFPDVKARCPNSAMCTQNKNPCTFASCMMCFIKWKAQDDASKCPMCRAFLV